MSSGGATAPTAAAEPQTVRENSHFLDRADQGDVTLVENGLTFPNGIAFSPDEKTLYVAVSDPKNPVIMSYLVQYDGQLSSGRVFFDAKPLTKGRKGLPDGLAGEDDPAAQKDHLPRREGGAPRACEQEGGQEHGGEEKGGAGHSGSCQSSSV